MGRTRVTQISAWGMSDHQIPPLTQFFGHVALDMLPWPLALQQVARPSIMPKGGERVPNDPAEFTGNKDSHIATLSPNHRSYIADSFLFKRMATSFALPYCKNDTDPKERRKSISGRQVFRTFCRPPISSRSGKSQS